MSTRAVAVNRVLFVIEDVPVQRVARPGEVNAEFVQSHPVERPYLQLGHWVQIDIAYHKAAPSRPEALVVGAYEVESDVYAEGDFRAIQGLEHAYLIDHQREAGGHGLSVVAGTQCPGAYVDVRRRRAEAEILEGNVGYEDAAGGIGWRRGCGCCSTCSR